MADHRPRVAILLASPMFVRNYLAAGAFATLARHADLQIFAMRALEVHDADLRSHEGFAGYIDVDPRLAARHVSLFNILMWRHRRRTGAFRFRALRHLGYEYVEGMRRGPFAARVNAAARLFRYLAGHPSVWAIPVLGQRPITELFLPLYVRFRLPVDPELRRVLTEAAPELIVVPTSAQDAVGDDAIRIGAELGVPTLFLVDNWDNLSSKSVMWATPDHVAVWGPQSAEQATRIHGLAPAQVHELGTPRFDSYYRARSEPPRPRLLSFEYLVFLGCALPFDEVSALRALDAEVASAPEVYGDLRIIYRPHPWRQHRSAEAPFDESTFRHVVLDPQLRAQPEGAPVLPSLDHYVPLLHHAALVVAPLTTMLIESLLFGKRALVLAYDDGVHFTSPHNALRHYEHFQGLEDLEAITLCRDLAALPVQLRQLYPTAGAPLRTDPDAEVAQYLHHDDRPYAARLAELVAGIVAARAGVQGEVAA